eukprot:TRINITY_DN21968_c0_g1_i1.p1 TRINITY_DN21968_c0_g1~~TRINITY_DN21968_c0_g1_i1.p1  ORF type:complete len:582 (+),score=139.24 TRINITY_DN21968_c0_g1_i1:42-1787(+)
MASGINLVAADASIGGPWQLPGPGSGSFSIGRKASCDLILPEAHAYVSGEHCRVKWGDEEGHQVLQVEDLSGNGTFVNGSKVGRGKCARVKLSDQISLAKPTRKGGAIMFRLESSSSVRPGAGASESSAAVPAPAPSPAPTAPARSAAAAAPAPAGAPAVTSASSTASAVSSAQGPSSTTGQLQQRQPSSREAPPPPAATNRLQQRQASSREQLPAAMATASRQRHAELQRLELRVEAEKNRCSALEVELHEERCQLAEARRRHRTFTEHAESHMQAAAARLGSSDALARENARRAQDCEELRESLRRLAAEQRPLERAQLAAAEAAKHDRRECIRLRAELEEEQRCAERAACETALLRTEVDEASTRTLELESEVRREEEFNASLEEQAAAACSEWNRTKSAVVTARRRLEERGAQLAALRGAMQKYHKKVSDRLSALERSIQQMPAASQGDGLGASAGSEAVAGNLAASDGSALELGAAGGGFSGPGHHAPAFACTALGVTVGGVSQSSATTDPAAAVMASGNGSAAAAGAEVLTPTQDAGVLAMGALAPGAEGAGNQPQPKRPRRSPTISGANADGGA